MRRRFALSALAVLALAAGIHGSSAQNRLEVYESTEDAQQALNNAEAQGKDARTRAEALETKAATASAAADKTAQESAALAARVQEAEAQIAANEAKIRLIGQQRQVLRAELAQRQRPLVELTAALQRLSRRPAVFSLLRPGSLQDAVYLRAVLETMLPEVARRTAGLRAAIERGKRLEAEAVQASADLRNSQTELNRRRQQLAALEARQRLDSRSASGFADREAERALALAEQARDLTGLVGELDKAGRLRDQLAALPGPLLRPGQPQNAAAPTVTEAAPAPTNAPAQYLLPVGGRLVAGFGDGGAGRAQSRGISIAARGGAQVVSPGAGRIVFAGPYQSYGSIVIIEHGGGWTSLVTGLALLDTRVGRSVVAGSPLGQAGPGRPVLTLELRKDGNPVNPLDFLRR
ncbi:MULTISPECIES: peptidoglycan DD-metalloendopeptidase family protein [unclassified Novosphingobium]|uniref:murein hydrolase activator EnvC family protein n=1 Tax=unclassified Novosphingobium TaxID=2644732 RepID=UPI000EEBC063|nr:MULTISPECIES: peptidoglycan DD-metalloendopeptidase family protein [unclassified Novosphingobium]HCF24280.1 metalloendopeptidase [Novosphingobium sp.]HQV02471.1 peptidoglycan DD-metalloendopeptidase family protein [Novosphingobium sp.]